MPQTIYIDGHAGTTGLVIHDLLAPRADVRLLVLDEADRKLDQPRREAIARADLSILCLPDEAARQAASWAVETSKRMIDASSAHRVSSNWIYGLPEMASEVRAAIRSAQFVANPGCYPTGAILILRPLVEQGILPVNAPLVIHALSGYSGGGKQMIAAWEDRSGPFRSLPFSAPYAMGRVHKHIPELMKYSQLTAEPLFLPRVGPFERGMRTEIPLHKDILKNCAADPCRAVSEILCDRYADEPYIHVLECCAAEPDGLSLDPRQCNGTNDVRISVIGHPSGHVTLIAILDNLGKGAAGAAVQSMNLMLGFGEYDGLD